MRNIFLAALLVLIAFTVNAQPFSTTQPLQTSICKTGSTLNLYNYVNKSTGVTFKVDGTSLASSTFNPGSYTIGTQYTITAEYTDLTYGAQAVEIGKIIVTANTVAVSQQPAPSVSACAGGTATISTLSLDPGVSYQWEVLLPFGGGIVSVTDDNIYSGSTSANLTLKDIPGSYNNYLYRCRIFNTCASTYTQLTQLKVFVPPSITADPVDVTTCETTSTNFSVTATASGSGAIFYQWEFTSGNGLWSNIPGATSSTYTIATAELDSAGYYRCKATKNNCAAFSNPAELIVDPLISITQTPEDRATCEGRPVTFTVKATGAPTISYQWQESTNGTTYADLTDGGIYNGAMSPTLTLLTTTPGMVDNKYRVVITNHCGNVTSTEATLTNGTVPDAPTLFSTAERCGRGNLSATVNSTATSTVFKWYTNETDNTSIFTGATFTINNLRTTQSRYASVSVLGCESEKTKVDFIVHAPKSVLLGGPLSLCIDQTPYDLAADITDPDAQSGVFSWADGAANYSSNTFDPSVVGDGAYTVKYDPPLSAQAAPDCYVSTNRMVSVRSAPYTISFIGTQVQSGNTINACIEGNPFTISNLPDVTGGTWSVVSGSGLSITGTTVVFTPSPSNYTPGIPNVFRYTKGTNSCLTEKDLNIYVIKNTNPPVVTGVPEAICPNSQIVATASVASPGTYTYQWFRAGAATPFSKSKTVTYSFFGNESLEVYSIDPWSCRSDATIIDLKTPFDPATMTMTADKNVVNAGEKISFTYSDAVPSNSVLWEFGDGGKSSQRNAVHYFYTPGLFTTKVTVTSAMGCSETFTVETITVNGEPIEIITGAETNLPPTGEMSFHPVPFTNSLWLTGSPYSAGTEITLISTLGSIVLHKTVSPTGSTSQIVSPDEALLIPPGLYKLIFKTSDRTEAITIIKQ